MTTKSPLEQAQARILALEAEVDCIRSDRDRLAGVIAGMTEQNARNLDALRRAEAENARLREALEFYAKDDANAVECGILGGVDDRPATKTLKEVG